MRICLVFNDCLDSADSGSTGWWIAGLARCFRQQGHEVDVLISSTTGSPGNASASSARARDSFFGSRVIHIKDLPRPKTDRFPLESNPAKSFIVHRFLREAHYHIVHFHDHSGIGFYSAMARRQGLLDSIVVTHIHGSSEWRRRHNLRVPDIFALETEKMERTQIENSDVIVSPCRYLLDWYASNGVKLPSHCELISWIIPQWLEDNSTKYYHQLGLVSQKIAPGNISEFIFFGQHERRQGLDLYVSALQKASLPRHVRITFIGPFDFIDHEFTGSYIFRKLRDYPGPIRLLNTLTPKEALQYMTSHRDAVCVVPSSMEASPWTIGQYFTLQIPFIATEVGGVPELIASADHQHVLCKSNADALATLLEQTIAQGLPSVASTLRPTEILAQWNALHDSILLRHHSFAPSFDERPLVSVCLVHYERPDFLRRALEGLFKQTYQNFEIVIVDDGSKSPEAARFLREIDASKHKQRVKVIFSDNVYLGAARNLAVSHAEGEYIMLHDDDNVAVPTEMEVFVRAAVVGGFDVLTSLAYWFDDPEGPEQGTLQYFSIGVGCALSWVSNTFGDANALIRRSVFDQVGGFTELHGVSWEDWEFFLKAYTSGCKMGIVPLPLFYYRRSSSGMLATGLPIYNHYRIFDAVRDMAPKLDPDFFLYAWRTEIAEQTRGTTWRNLGAEHMHALHRELMSVDPNSAAAKAKLVELAFGLGRVSDAVDLGFQVVSLQERLHALISAMGESYGKGRIRRVKSLAIRTGRQISRIDGWIATPELEGRTIALIKFHGRMWFPLEQSVVERPDVGASFGSKKQANVGFRCYLQLSDVTEPPEGPQMASVALNSPLGEMLVYLAPPASTQEGLGALQGHVDSVTWFYEYDLTEALSSAACPTGRLEVINLPPVDGCLALFRSKTFQGVRLNDHSFALQVQGGPLPFTAADLAGESVFLYVAEDAGSLDVTIYHFDSHSADKSFDAS